ncbi:hypothetical protein, partial [Bradyrhizobium sp. AS23.2]|uniref:hypothetical protein n=1 Tax=Bradyrhizobium sp. AS23.2 TaxID=1680155 RepID=UPI001AD83D3A
WQRPGPHQNSIGRALEATGVAFIPDERARSWREDEEAQALIFLFRSTPPLSGPQPAHLRASKEPFSKPMRMGKSGELTHPIKERIFSR